MPKLKLFFCLILYTQAAAIKKERNCHFNPHCLQVAQVLKVQQRLLFLPLDDTALTFCTCISETAAAGFRCFGFSVIAFSR